MPATIRASGSPPSAHGVRVRVRPEAASWSLWLVPFLSQTPIGFVWLIFGGYPLSAFTYGFLGFFIAFYICFAAVLSLAICAVVGVFITAALRSPDWQYLTTLGLCVLLSFLLAVCLLVYMASHSASP